jgi:flagellar assembly protein FliH
MAEVFKAVRVSEDFVYLGQSVDRSMKKKETTEVGYQLGFNQGLVEGQRQGQEQALAENQEISQQLKRLLETIHSALTESRLALKTEIADVVFRICQQFLIGQLQNKEEISQQIAAALHEVNDKQNLTLFLNTLDLLLLQKGELKIDLAACKNLRIVADQNLTLGGCLIQSEQGLFDASIERKIECLKQVLISLKTREAKNMGVFQHG